MLVIVPSDNALGLYLLIKQSGYLLLSPLTTHN